MCRFFSENSCVCGVVCVWYLCVCVCSPRSYFMYHTGVSVAPGDSQSVLALQYMKKKKFKKILIFKKLPPELGTVFVARPSCGTARLEYIICVCVWLDASMLTLL